MTIIHKRQKYEYRRVTFVTTPKGYELIEDLTKLAGTSTASGAIRQAIDLYSYILQMQQNGSKLSWIHPDGRQETMTIT